MQQTLDQIFALFLQASGATIDNRNITGGELFFGLKGEKTNGGAFAAEALQKGAGFCIVDDEKYVIDDRCIVVDDVLITMQLLAKKYRDTFNFPVLALTGSNGKTTTKELIAAVLSKKYRVTATKGNLNNHIGVPLTILNIPRDCNFAVIEMGANHQKEIASYCTYANPNYALITNIGKAHLEGFGGVEGVLKGKSELFHYVREKNGHLFINGNETKLLALFADYKNKSLYGFNETDYTYGKIIEGTSFATVRIDNKIDIASHLVGDYNANNIIAAAAIGKYFGVEYPEIAAAIAEYTPDNNRSEMKLINGNYFILDAYNANPSSMKAALENFAKNPAKQKIIILGDMLELGEYAHEEHAAIINLAQQGNFDLAITVGPLFLEHQQTSFLQFDSADAAKQWFKAQQFNGATILLKGSRGMRLESIIAD